MKNKNPTLHRDKTNLIKRKIFQVGQFTLELQNVNGFKMDSFRFDSVKEPVVYFGGNAAEDFKVFNK